MNCGRIKLSTLCLLDVTGDARNIATDPSVRLNGVADRCLISFAHQSGNSRSSVYRSRVLCVHVCVCVCVVGPPSLRCVAFAHPAHLPSRTINPPGHLLPSPSSLWFLCSPPIEGHQTTLRSARPSARPSVCSMTQLTRSLAIADGPRDAPCQLKSCQLPRNSAETTCATSPEPSISCR